jgi:hypothetical protein
VKRQPLVGTCTITDFFENSQEAIIPDYQRPYVWNEEKLEQLIEDLEAHFLVENTFDDISNYYLGTILVCEKDNQYEIIDGQQRITTLLLLDYAWRKDESILSQGKWKLSYKSLLSKKTIRNNVKVLESSSSKARNKIEFIFSKLVITLIITTSEDEAFTFFDSQNNRGVSLSPVDFLKSYHLRALGGKKDLQRTFATQWDSNNCGQFLNIIFSHILWRNRNWKGKSLWYGDKDAILKTFQKQTIKSIENNSVTLYPNAFNALSSHLEFDSQTGVSIQPNRLNLQTRSEDYPFAIRQPVEKGTGFFLYTEKYHAIYTILFKEFRFNELEKCYKELYNDVSRYLRMFFELAVISYYDKYKDYKLLEFALWLDYLLGSYRINQHSIVAQTIIKILRDNRQNLLDVIEMSYRPETVFEFIQSITDDSFYTNEDKATGGVRKQYKENNLTYYNEVTGNENSLTNKKKWINAKLTQK